MENKKFDEEYEKLYYYYQFDYKNFFDDIYNSYISYSGDSIQDIEQFLLKLNQKDKKIIEEGLNKFQDHVTSTIDHSFDAFEIFVLNNVLKLPSNLEIKVLIIF
jgi:hypothetical protein